MSLIDKHQNYMQFLQNNGMLDEKRKKSIVREIHGIYQILQSRPNKRDSPDNDEENSYFPF